MNINFEKGFTLIELLVVISIIGILAGILFVAIDPKGQSDKARDAKILSQLSQIPTQAAIESLLDYNVVCQNNSQTNKLLKKSNISDVCKSNTTSFVAVTDKKLSKNNLFACIDKTGIYGISSTAKSEILDTSNENYNCNLSGAQCMDSSCCSHYQDDGSACEQHGCTYQPSLNDPDTGDFFPAECYL